MKYIEAVNYLKNGSTPGSVYGLTRVEQLLHLLGSPEKKLKFIHVAGTNGKGSTSRMLQGILTLSGYKTGIFNSPFLSEPLEYMCIDGKNASKRSFSSLVEKIKKVCEGMETPPTEFEMSVAMAIYWFAKNRCDFAIMECGLGGLTDATNVIPSPELAVITNIGFDHTAILGNTIREIAEQKCGIIKKNCSVVAYDSGQEALKVIRDRCLQLGVRLRIPGGSLVQTDAVDSVFNGGYQKKNAELAVCAVTELKSRGYDIPEAAVLSGLADFSWPARFEIKAENPYVIFDGGHNPQCAQALADGLRNIGIDKAVLVIGVMKDKDVNGIFDILKPFAGYVIGTEPDNPRRLAASEIAENWRKRGISSKAVISPSKALKAALRIRKLRGLPVICTGSLYMMGELEKSFGRFIK